MRFFGEKFIITKQMLSIMVALLI